MLPSHLSSSNPPYNLPHWVSRASRLRAVPRPAAPDLAARVPVAAALLPADPDAAALVLEGAAHTLIAHWYARQGLRPPAPERLLADLAARDALLALRLRLALRAPDVAARLDHLRALLRVLAE